VAGRGALDDARARTALLLLLTSILAVGAAQRLADGFLQLAWRPAAPVDLELRWHEVSRWAAGQPVYGAGPGGYPLATYPLLWVAIGWLDFAAARALWAATSLLAIAWLAWLSAREAGARTGLALAAAALLPAAVYPTRAVLVNGQLTLHVLPPLIVAALLLHRRAPSWPRDLAAAGLLIVGLTKPTIAGPFLALLPPARGPWRPMALVGAGYGTLTLLAAAFQPEGVLVLLGRFLTGAVPGATGAAASAHANLHTWLGAVGLGWASLPASLLALGALGVALWRWRAADVWVALGLAAVVARLWTYHYRYDDLLLLVPLIALARLAIGSRGTALDRPAAVLVALLGASLLLPARLLVPPSAWIAPVETAQTVVWLATGIVLARRARAATGGLGARAG